MPESEVLRNVTASLPLALTSFVGRGDEVDEVCRLLQLNRLVTVAGPGGSGKTRMSVEVARTRLETSPEGLWVVDLAPISAPDQVVVAALAALGATRGTGNQLTALVELIGPRDLLLLLDNCEHLLAPVATMVECVLRRCPGVRILTTSREPVGIGGEAVWRIPPLGLPDDAESLAAAELSEVPAVTLFVTRGMDANPAFELSDLNSRAVIRVCRAVDSLPLGIELAAARLGVLSVEQLADRLQHNLRLLSSRRRTVSERHQTMGSAIGWSFDLLPPQDQVVFRRLAVFSGGWTVEAAEEVCCEGVDTPVLDILQSLVDKSLVIADLVDALPRYRVLETIREFIVEKLSSSGEACRLATRHCQWFAGLAEAGARDSGGREQRLWMDRLEADHENIRAALSWAEEDPNSVPDGLRMVRHLQWFWHYRGYAAEGLERTRRLLARDAGGHAAARAGALVVATTCAVDVADFTTCDSLGPEAIALARELDDCELLGSALLAFGHSLAFPGRPPGADKLLIEARRLADRTGDNVLLCRVLHSLSVIESERGDVEAANVLVREALALAGTLGHDLLRALFLMQLGDGARIRGTYAAAASYLGKALEVAHWLGVRRMIGMIDLNLGLLAVEVNDRQGALLYLRRALEGARREMDSTRMATSIVALAAVRGQEGDGATANRWLEAVTVILPDFRMCFGDQRIQDLAHRLARANPGRELAVPGHSVPASIAELVHEVLSTIATADTERNDVERLAGAPMDASEPERASDAASWRGLDGSVLTRREIEVLGLLSEGQSNREIADALMISVNTVERHVTHVYAKISARNRAEATAFALRRYDPRLEHPRSLAFAVPAHPYVQRSR